MNVNFHNKDFALNLAFIKRFKATRKWPIETSFNLHEKYATVYLIKTKPTGPHVLDFVLGNNYKLTCPKRVGGGGGLSQKLTFNKWGGGGEAYHKNQPSTNGGLNTERKGGGGLIELLWSNKGY